MPWYDEPTIIAHFGGAAAVQVDTDAGDWADATKARVLADYGPQFPKMADKNNLRLRAFEYCQSFLAAGTTDTFPVWYRARYPPVVAVPVAVAVAPSTPRTLAPTAPPVPSGQDIPAFSSFAVHADTQVGHSGMARQRIKLKFHLLPNEWEQAAELKKVITKRTLKWVRRVYAQANLGPPKAIEIEEIPEVHDNTLTIAGVRVPGYAVSVLASGVNAAGTPSKITLELTEGANPAATVEVALAAGRSTADMAADVAGALRGAGYTVVGPTRHLSDATHHTSHDMVVTLAGAPVKIKAGHDDTMLGKDVLEVPSWATSRGMDEEDSLYGGSPMQRKLLRLGTVNDDQIDIYVIAKGGLNGRAYPPYGEVGVADAAPGPTGLTRPARAPLAPYRNAAYLAFWSTGNEAKGKVFDLQLEVSPFTLPHEIGHVLADTGHTGAEGDLMNGGWAKDNSATANKRIYGKPLLVGSLNLETGVERSGQDLQAEMRTTRGNPNLLGGW